MLAWPSGMALIGPASSSLLLYLRHCQLTRSNREPAVLELRNLAGLVEIHVGANDKKRVLTGMFDFVQEDGENGGTISMQLNKSLVGFLVSDEDLGDLRMTITLMRHCDHKLMRLCTMVEYGRKYDEVDILFSTNLPIHDRRGSFGANFDCLDDVEYYININATRLLDHSDAVRAVLRFDTIGISLYCGDDVWAPVKKILASFLVNEWV